MIFSNLILLSVCKGTMESKIAKHHHDSTAKERMFDVKEDVRNYGPGAKWIPGGIVKQTGPVSFLVKLTDGCLCHCHQDCIWFMLKWSQKNL